MTDLVRVEDTTIVEPECQHAPLPIEFQIVYGTHPVTGDMLPSKVVASKFACHKCNRLLPIDLKHLALRDG